MIKLNQIGDTIIEVMLAMAVIGMTIGGAYGIANRSLRAAQVAQERGEALKVAESQLEIIKALSSSGDGGDVFNTSSRFCMTYDEDSENWDTETIDDMEDDGLHNTEECTDGIYNKSITRQSLDGGEDNGDEGEARRHQFTVQVSWYQIGSDNVDEIKIDYRIYRGNLE